MDEKPIETKEKQPIVKKVYTPPAVTVYGKLTELTAGGTQDKNEPTDPHATSYPFKKP